MTMFYIILMWQFLIAFGQELKQDSVGSPFNLKCSQGSYVSSVSSTFSDSNDDHRIYKLKCLTLQTQGTTTCKPGSESEYSKDFSIGCSGNEYLAGLESTEFKNQDRKFRTLCCSTDTLSVSACQEINTRGTAGFNIFAKANQIIQKVSSKYVLSKQNGKFIADRSFVFTLCDTSVTSPQIQLNPADNLPNPPQTASQPIPQLSRNELRDAPNPSALVKNAPSSIPFRKNLNKGNNSPNSASNSHSVQLPEKKSIIDNPHSSGPVSNNAGPPATAQKSLPPPDPAPPQSSVPNPPPAPQSTVPPNPPPAPQSTVPPSPPPAPQNAVSPNPPPPPKSAVQPNPASKPTGNAPLSSKPRTTGLKSKQVSKPSGPAPKPVSKPSGPAPKPVSKPPEPASQSTVPPSPPPAPQSTVPPSPPPAPQNAVTPNPPPPPQNAVPPNPPSSPQNAVPPGPASQNLSPSSPPKSQHTGPTLRTRPKANEPNSPSGDKSAPVASKSSSSNSGGSPQSSNNGPNSSAAKSIAIFNQKKTGGGGGGNSGSGGGGGSSGGGGDDGFTEESSAFQSFDIKCPTGSAIRAIKIKRVDQGSKHDAVFSLKCDKLPDYIDTKNIEDQILDYNAIKDGSVQSPCDPANGQFLCGLKGIYDENRGVEAHCCRIKDTIPSFSQNPLTIVPTVKGGVLKADPSKEEFVGNLDQLSDGTFVGQMIVFGKLYPVKGTNILTAEGCRCKCDCSCPKNKTRARRRRSSSSSIVSANEFTYQLVNDRHKRQEDTTCSGQCECKCVIPNC